MKKEKKNEVISIALKVIAVLIIIIGAEMFYELRLWDVRARANSTESYFFPISVLGFSGALYGIATLLDNKTK